MHFYNPARGVVEKEKLQNILKGKFRLMLGNRKEAEYAELCNNGEM